MGALIAKYTTAAVLTVTPYISLSSSVCEELLRQIKTIDLFNGKMQKKW
jgi:hypothetical protein